ncbi:MAG: hypothetical protein EP343_08940 [Deltaproteobacteria bacterium]|nr:MAG: hypothetical protein EP343_08940 [Deltaproteobacteria bacterium]
MPYDVLIPKEQQPIFPEQCIECGQDNPGDTVRFRSSMPTRKPLKEAVFKSWTFDVPCCPGCKRKFHRGRRLGKVLFGVGVLVSVLLLLGVIQFWPGLLKSNWLGLLVVFGAIVLPVAAVNALVSAAVEVHPRGDSLYCSFRDSSYAEAFAELNDAEVR